ncbi:hypothetical protein GCM10010136_15150 [Limoniibacter endophyticus]|uniref:Uncharacterized protein n=1 Tax=Limoniibacter endophyticus TaxID=1565040 RepID=A0A8J3GI10_9HYPH|nr:hypothetical protein GCM10010136_15150 [Limoniibacter endophyticus]
MAGLAGNAELAAQRRYLLAIQNPRNKSETLARGCTPAKAPSLSSLRQKVQPISRKGHTPLGKELGRWSA